MSLTQVEVEFTSMSKAQRKAYADLLIQAMLFDMDVDWETWTLVPKKKDTVPFWQKKWRANEQSADRQPEDYEGGKDER